MADNDDNNNDLSDLPLSQDGNSGDNQGTLDNLGNDKLDKMLDEHIGATSRDQNTTRETRQARDGRTTAESEGTGRQTRTQSTQRDNKDNQQQNTQQRGQSNVDGQEGSGRTFQPRQLGAFLRQGPNGDVYSIDGRRIAAAGAGYNVAQRVANLYAPLEREHAALKQRVETYDNANAAARAEGLTLEDQAMGLRLAAAWKRDPVQTLNFLLNQAVESGKDVSSIRNGGGVDPVSLGSMIEERLSKALEPFQVFVRNAQSEQENAEIRERVTQDIEAFFEDFPGSRMHRQALGAIMQHTGDTPKEAWFRLRAEAAQHGWDLNRPLAEQAQSTRSASPNGGGNRQPRIPSFNGRGNGTQRSVPSGSLEIAGADDSWDKIIQDTVAGLERQ